MRSKPLLFLFCVLLISSCSREKDTFLSRSYHKTTARFNGYFNAKEIIKENEFKLSSNQEEDYSQLLPVFIYPDEKASQNMFPDMDKVIEKCSQVIDRHSMYIRRKEKNKWIDDSYFLIGKARFYKQEFGLAEETFLYVYQAFKGEPHRYNGLNWLIRTYIETKNWEKAEDFFDIAEKEKNRFPDEYKGEHNAIYADYFLKKNQDKAAAIEKLETAILFTKDRDESRRLTYILAQLQLEKKNYSVASELFSKVLKLRPDYTMRFNARINRAIAYDVSSDNSEDIKKELFKMLKDSKNEEFKDQIYYALADIAIKEDDEPLGIRYLKRSAKTSVNNVKQKALSYLRLADIYFEQPHYVNAQSYFDSTLLYLPEDHPEYYEAESKNNSLQELVRNLKIIDFQDSILSLSNLSEQDQRKKVKEIIKNLKEEEEKARQAEMRKLQLAQQASQTNSDAFGGGNRKGEWYFYNQTTMDFGKNEFRRLWGERDLRDHWRRSKMGSNLPKSQPLSTSETDAKAEKNLADSTAITDENKYDEEAYLAGIPSDINQQLTAHGKVSEALFNVGTIFKESFLDYKSAVKAFNRIITDYDTSVYNLPSHYQLYRIYLLNDDKPNAEKMKEWIMEYHPFSEYAYLIKNPNYNKQSKATKEKVDEYYEATYKLYRYGLYEDVISSCEKADESFSENHLKAKFDLLKARSIGHLGSPDDVRIAMERLVADHPGEAEIESAQAILDYIKQMNKPKKVEKEEKKKKGKVKYNLGPAAKHMVIVSGSNKSPEFKSLKNRLSNFNKSYFREDKLEIASSILKNKDLYMIKSFENQSKSERYFKALRNNTELMQIIKRARAQEYLISIPNFQLLFGDKDEATYLEFFKQNYTL